MPCRSPAAAAATTTRCDAPRDRPLPQGRAARQQGRGARTRDEDAVTRGHHHHHHHQHHGHPAWAVPVGRTASPPRLSPPAPEGAREGARAPRTSARGPPQSGVRPSVAPRPAPPPRPHTRTASHLILSTNARHATTRCHQSERGGAPPSHHDDNSICKVAARHGATQKAELVPSSLVAPSPPRPALRRHYHTHTHTGRRSERHRWVWALINTMMEPCYQRQERVRAPVTFPLLYTVTRRTLSLFRHSLYTSQ
ncbi:hypothetical protein O3P69_012944 [Scylla paramamosain]|uniref:Uncharacterized protein n=1 Tax=Scylla paramamosain TaxID=85552 RepID=A0AAW0TQT4_SCYPA